LKAWRIIMKRIHTFKLLICMAFFAAFTDLSAATTPKLTVIIVVDQFAQSYIQKLYPYFRYGLKKLLDKGIVYENAYVPHGMPATGTGHTALNTGAYANYHGIIGNKWFDAEGKTVECDDDTAQNAAVFGPKGLYNYGKSPRNIMVEGISDQFKRAARPGTQHHVYTFSLKSRAAISSANKLGKAIWFDNTTGHFTSSKAYFDTIPDWIDAFNKEKKIDQLKQVTWKLMYPRDSKAYNFKDVDDYTFSDIPKSLINIPIPIGPQVKKNNSYALYNKTPYANELVFNLAKTCMDQYMNKKADDRMLLWVDVSSLDKLGHAFGPESLEAIDMVYHLDKQIDKIMNHAQKLVGKEQVLFALTADHGIGCIPEQLKKEGLYHARRILIPQLIIDLNSFISKKHGLNNLVQNIKQPHVYLDQNQLKKMKPKQKEVIIQDLKKFLESQIGIKTVWTYDELKHASFNTNEYANYFKQQLFPNRSGQLIIQTFPHVVITKYPNGSSHKTPYEYDTHVPLMLYQKDQLEEQKIQEKVFYLQLANTLAEILDVQKVPASGLNALPGIKTENE
jgi:predicted AlkP superfamily pyrophosphatase or phosphodiesterase